MTNKVYLVGYSGLTPERLRNIATSLGATVIDIRFRAGSRVACWNKSALAASLGRYRHVPALGNAEYKTGGMRIADYATGKAAIEAAESPVILMCACKSPDGCHRTVVGEMLRRDGFDVTELNAPAGK